MILSGEEIHNFRWLVALPTGRGTGITAVALLLLMGHPLLCRSVPFGYPRRQSASHDQRILNDDRCFVCGGRCLQGFDGYVLSPREVVSECCLLRSESCAEAFKICKVRSEPCTRASKF